MKIQQMLLSAGAAATLTAGPAGAAQPVSGPIATYWMSASTTSGIGAMVSGLVPQGGQRPSLGAMMRMGMSGGPDPNAVNHGLILQLGSSHRPDGGAPTAEHDAPASLGVGAVLPLLSPQPQAKPAYEESTPAPPPQYRQPHGRMLIFWGCGEHAPAGQPLVIDFSQLDQAGAAQRFAGLARGMAVTPMQPPSPTRNVTYGEWPNRDARKVAIPANGSLQGDHLVRGNYSPDIKFSLTADQDFLPPIQMTTNARNAGGSATLAWRAVDGAQGYFATLFGAGGRDQIVMWTSSANQTSAFALPDYLSNGEISRLVGARALMPPAQTTCVVPREVVAAAGSAGFFQLAAYGGETNLSWPPRPPSPKAWNIAWQVKVRYRSTNSGVLGMDMSHLGGRGGPGGQSPDQPKKKRPSLFNPLGGIIP